MKIKKKEVMLLLALLGVLAAVLVYFYIYMPTLEKTEVLEAENANHATYIAQLEAWEAQVDTFQKETEQMIVDVNDIFVRFPVESKTEDAIMYAVELEAEDADTYISAIGVTDPAVVYASTPTTVKLNEHMEDGERIYELYSQQITYTQQFSYDGMKRYVDSIVNDYDRKSIETLNLAYDSSNGQLMGSTSVNLFTLKGTDKVYQNTVIPSMPMGVENIFGTLKLEEGEAVEAGNEEAPEAE